MSLNNEAQKMLDQVERAENKLHVVKTWLGRYKKQKVGANLVLLDSPKIDNVEDGNCMVKCPSCGTPVHVLSNVVSVCRGCGRKYTMLQLNLIFLTEEVIG